MIKECDMTKGKKKTKKSKKPHLLTHPIIIDIDPL